MRTSILYLRLAFGCLVIVTANAHGYLKEPPGRASMWRYGFDTPINYNDNQLFCGGFGSQYNNVNQGRCGICGDEWSLPQPRPHEGGGTGTAGTIARTYNQGDAINVEVKITASHKGWFEFRLCPHNNPGVPATPECLDQYLLALTNGTTRVFGIESQKIFEFSVQLPTEVTCSQCVLQWKYHTGNSWGVDENGVGGIGRGNQEEFYSCADIQILATQEAQQDDEEESMASTTISSSTNSATTQATTTTTEASSTLSSTTTVTVPTTTTPTADTPSPSTVNSQTTTTSSGQPATAPSETTSTDPPSTTTLSSTSATSMSGVQQPDQRSSLYDTWACSGTGQYASMPGIEDWCVSSCAMGFCPTTHCDCDLNAMPDPDLGVPVHSPGPNTICSGRGQYFDVAGLDQWCENNCRAGYCPESHCVCFDFEIASSTVQTPVNITCTAKRRFRKTQGNRRAAAWCTRRCERLDAHNKCGNRCNCVGFA